MIIRSGLIKNRDTVDFGEFSKHWKDVHGPLALNHPLIFLTMKSMPYRSMGNTLLPP